MSVYDPDRLPRKLIKKHNDPLCVVVLCSRCTKKHVRKITELMCMPVVKCDCDYDFVNKKRKDIINKFTPYYMDYRILKLKGQLFNHLSDEQQRRKILLNYTIGKTINENR